MEILFKQEQKYGCAHYALANFLNEPKVLEFIKPGYGSQLEDLNECLRAVQPGFWFSTLVSLISSLPVQNRFIDVALFSLEHVQEEFKGAFFRPFLCSIKNAVFHHAILVVQDCKTETLSVFDSLKSEVKVFTPEQFVLNYWVVEICELNSEITRESCKIGSEQLSLFFKYENFPHLKP